MILYVLQEVGARPICSLVALDVSGFRIKGQWTKEPAYAIAS
jgi:hypothetical protein